MTLQNRKIHQERNAQLYTVYLDILPRGLRKGQFKYM